MGRPSAVRRFRTWGAGLLLFTSLPLWGAVSADTPGDGVLRGVQVAAHPYRFNLGLWELAHLVELRPNTAERGTSAATERYFTLAQELRRVQADLLRAQAMAGVARAEEVRAAEARRDSLLAEMERLAPAVRRDLQGRVGRALAEEGLLRTIPFPPATFVLGRVPQALVVSPRERMEVLETVHLRADIGGEEVEALEAVLERRGLSALVTPLGGLSTYPALVASEASLGGALSVAAHEWTHHYLFFQPLGQRHGDGPGMATINETVANIVGGEVAARILGETPPLLRAPAPQPPLQHPRDDGGFDASRFLRETRLEAERLLSAGRIDEAEAYMEERRRVLAENGVFIRRLNQAFFAFHGTYADSPTSVSPVFEQLAAVRRSQPTLGDFLRTVAQVTRPEELAALAIRAASSP